MLKSINDKIVEIRNNQQKKPTYNVVQVVELFQSLNNGIEKELELDDKLISVPPISSGKLNKVDVIKRYDVIYVSILAGVPHYMIVDKVVDESVYCLLVTSKLKEHVVLEEIKFDRIFAGNFISNIYITVSLEEAKKSFVRVYEDKAEAYRFFAKIEKYYKKLFNLKQ